MKINCVYDFISPKGPIPNGYHLKYIYKLWEYDYDINNSEFIDDYYKEDVINVKQSLLLLGIRNADISTNDLVLNDGYVLRKNELYFYNICSAGNIFSTLSLKQFSKNPHILSYVSDKLKELLSNSNNLYIVIEYIMEGQIDMNVIDSIYLHCKFNNIPTDKIIFVSSVFNIDKIHEKYCSLYPQDKKIKTTFYNWAIPFKSHELEHALNIKNTDSALYVKNSISKKIEFDVKEKKALLLNRRLRLHRLILLSMLAEDDYLKDTLFSFDLSMDSFPNFYNWIDGEYFQKTKMFNHDEYVNKSKNGYLKIKKINKKTIDYDSLHDVIGNGYESEDIYKRTYFSIVTETEFFEESYFLSEKSIKPIMHLHPFVIVGSPYTLKLLKSYGFKTFSNWWDESYDLMEDTNERILTLYNLILSLLKKTDDEWVVMVKEMREVLIHNRKLLLKYNTESINKIISNNFVDVIFNNKQILF